MGTMVFISGKHDWGKSTLIKALVKKIPMTKITYIDFNGEECPEPNGSGDILCRGVVKSFDGSEKNIGFSSGGDTAKHIENAFKALTVNKENLDIFVSACRQRGDTVFKAAELAKKYGFELILASNYHGVDLSSSDWFYNMRGKNLLSSGVDLNDICAGAMVELIRNL